MPKENSPRPVPPDYDRDPERFRLARSVLARHARVGDIHQRVATRVITEGLTPVLDVGCGEGELARHLPEGAWVGLDSSSTMLARAPKPSFQGEATALPFEDSSFASVALLYVLYHLAEPARALAEARRVLRAGGLVVVAAPSRHDSPELGDAIPRESLSFDAELAPQFLAEQFTDVEVERWDAPLLDLPTHEAVRDYLIGKGVSPARAHAAAQSTEVPCRSRSAAPSCSRESPERRGRIVWAHDPVPIPTDPPQAVAWREKEQPTPSPTPGLAPAANSGE